MPDSPPPVGETPQERAERLAYTAGKLQAQTEARFDGHEDRLNMIQLSLTEHSQAIHELRDAIDALTENVRVSTAVEAERVKQVRQANEQQISSRMFWLGVAAIIATITAACITVVANAHGINP